MKDRLIFDKVEAERQYDICRLEALMMNLETMQMFPEAAAAQNSSASGNEE